MANGTASHRRSSCTGPVRRAPHTRQLLLHFHHPYAQQRQPVRPFSPSASATTQRPCKVRRYKTRTRWCLSSSLDYSLCTGIDTTHKGTDTQRDATRTQHSRCCPKTQHAITSMRFRTTLRERWGLSFRVIASASDGSQRALRTLCVGSALHQRLVPPGSMIVRGRNQATSRVAHALVMMGTDRRLFSSTSLAVRSPDLSSFILKTCMCTVGYYLPNHQLVICTDLLDSFEDLAELLG